MSRGLPKIVKEHLEKCRDSAIAAVDAYNRPGKRFRTAQYIVLIVMAWTALFHAVFYKKGEKPWYKKKGGGRKGVRYVRVDGEVKYWELSECLSQFYGSEMPPERMNLEMLIGLRNKIEHRNIPELDAGLYGECQSALMNLESLLLREFGEDYALAEQLSIALQFSSVMPDERSRALHASLKQGISSVIKYVENFRSRLPDSVLNSTKYSYAIYLVPKVSGKEKFADAVVSFIKSEDAPNGHDEVISEINVIIKDRHVEVANLERYKPKDVVRVVADSLPFVFNLSHHTAAWKYFNVRPSSESSRPEQTNAKYCVYDKAHKDYLYSNAWIRKLISDLKDGVAFKDVTGCVAKPKTIDH
ncbi:MAG: DUF3644 domain-containing protein [Lautropia sp.]|nr:DUF3644 domain-containing protein [Lautropia sp.]